VWHSHTKVCPTKLYAKWESDKSILVSRIDINS